MLWIALAHLNVLWQDRCFHLQARARVEGSGWCTQIPRMEPQRSKESQLIIQPRSTLSNIVLHFTPCVCSC